MALKSNGVTQVPDGLGSANQVLKVNSAGTAGEWGTITSGDLTEGSTNLFFTDARADARVALLVDSAPSTLDTLNELASALGDDANFSTTVTNSIATKLPLAGGTLTGGLTVQSGAVIINNSGGNSQIYLGGTGGSNMMYLSRWGNDTLLWNADSGVMRFGTNNSEAMRIDSSGNVGIGTTNPTVRTGMGLVINGGTNQARLALKNDSTGDSSTDGFQIVVTSGSGSDGGQAILEQRENNIIAFKTNGSEAMRILPSGNVGIGEVNPLHPLHVDGTIYSTNNIQLNSTKQVLFGNGNQYIKGTNDTSIEIGTGGTATITATHAGDVEISGALKLSDTAVLDNATATTTTVSQTAIDQWSASTYGGGKIIIEAKAGAERQITELLVTHNGTTASAVEYGAVFTGGKLATYDVDISGGNVRILVVASSTTSTSYKVVRTTMFA
jgi:hypothetical protein